MSDTDLKCVSDISLKKTYCYAMNLSNVIFSKTSHKIKWLSKINMYIGIAELTGKCQLINENNCTGLTMKHTVVIFLLNVRNQQLPAWKIFHTYIWWVIYLTHTFVPLIEIWRFDKPLFMIPNKKVMFLFPINHFRLIEHAQEIDLFSRILRRLQEVLWWLVSYAELAQIEKKIYKVEFRLPQMSMCKSVLSIQNYESGDYMQT